MSAARTLISIAAVIVALCASSAAHAWSVLGCPFGPDVPAFIGCVNDASARAASTAVENASTAYEDTIEGLEGELEALQQSELMAALPGEQQALLALRQMPIEDFNTCLAEAGLNMGTVMGGAMTNPTGFAQARINEMLARTGQLSGPLLSEAIGEIGAGQLPQPTPQTISRYVDLAYGALERLAQEDPVARCALPLLALHESQIKQAAVVAFGNARVMTDQVVAQTVRPVLDQAVAGSLNAWFDQISGSAADSTGGTAAPAPRQRPDLRRAPPPGKPARERRTSTDRSRTAAAKTGSSAVSSRRNAEQKTPPRTPVRTRSIRDLARTGQDLARDAAQTGQAVASDAAQAVAMGMVPADVERIALGVFMEQLLDPARLGSMTEELRELSAAVENGTASPIQIMQLDGLLDELSVTGGTYATEVGIELARFYGHHTIDTVGAAIVDAGLGSAAAAEAVAMEVGGAICSIGDVFSGVPCAIIKGIVSFVYLQVALPALNQGMLLAYHHGYENLVSCAAERIRDGRDPASGAAVQDGCGAMAGLLQAFPNGPELIAFAMPRIEDTRAALFAYQQAVRDLALARSN